MALHYQGMSRQADVTLISPENVKSNEHPAKFHLYLDSKEWKPKSKGEKSLRDVIEINDLLQSMSLETGEIAKIYFDDDPGRNDESLDPKSEEKLYPKSKANFLYKDQF